MDINSAINYSKIFLNNFINVQILKLGMASGDVTVFNQFKEDLGNKVFDLDGDTLKLALVTSVVTPAATTAGPHFGGTGTTNLATNEVTAGGNYTAGGVTLTSTTFNEATGTVTFDAADISITQAAGNPTNARWGIIYSDTDTNKRCIAFVDLGSDSDLSGGNFTITWNASGIFTLA